MVEGLLNSSVVDKDKVAKNKVEHLNCCLVVCLKANSGLDSGSNNSSMEATKI